MQLCDEAPKYLIVLVAIKQSTPFLRLSRVLLSLYILQIRPSALTRFCPKRVYPTVCSSLIAACQIKSKPICLYCQIRYELLHLITKLNYLCILIHKKSPSSEGLYYTQQSIYLI